MTRTDVDGNNAFNYAVEEGQTLDHNLVRTLIIDGECINWKLHNVEDHEGVLVLDRIPSDIIEDVLNKCIEEHNGNSNNRKRENYKIKMNLSIFSHENNESLFIKALQNSISHRHLLSHPLISTFLHIKWQKVKYIWYLNEVFNMSFYFLILGFIFSMFLKGNEDFENQTLKIIITTMASFLMVREIMQLKLFKLYYFTSLNNILELSIIVMTMMLLYYDKYISKESIGAWLVVLITLELFLLLEKLHLSQISLYISMFRKITFNFVKLTSLLFCLVIAFGISFYYLLHLQSKGNLPCVNQNASNTTGELNQNKFADNLMGAILKTVIMSTGEFDFSDLDFRCFPASRLLFAVFIFSTFLVGMNLLNGIAISDIQDIQNCATEYQVVDQIECILYIENWRLLYSCILPTKAWTPGLVFKTCFNTDKTITYYPNRRFPSSLVTCEGHKQLWYTHRFVFHSIKLINLISWIVFGDVKTLCKQCRSQSMVEKHECLYKHNYIIPPTIVALAKEIKDNEKKMNEVDHMQNLKVIWKKYQNRAITRDTFVIEIGNA